MSRLRGVSALVSQAQLVEGDDPLADVGGPFHHGVGRRIAIVAGHGVLGRVAVGAQDPHGVGRALGNDLAGEVLRLRDVEPVVEPSLVFGPGGLVDEEPCGFDFGRHLRDHVLVHLELADLLPELLAVVRVLDGRIQAGLGQPDGAGRGREARLVERAEDDLGPVAGRTQKVLLGEAAIGDEYLAGRRRVGSHLLEFSRLDAVEVFRLQDEGRQSLGFLGAVGVRVVDQDIGHVGV